MGKALEQGTEATSSVSTGWSGDKGSGRILYFDVLNVVATLCVVALHCNGSVYLFEQNARWGQALMVEVLAYWAVPIFFMLSGATLMGYRRRYGTKVFIKKRLMRVGIPWLCWSLIFYALLWNGLPTHNFYTLFMGSGIQPTYWFFFPLCAIYLSMPILSLMRDKNRVLWYMVIVAFALQSLLPTLLSLFHLPWNGDLSLPLMGGYLIFPVLGYLLANIDIPKRHRMVLYGLGLACVLFRYVYTLLRSFADGIVDTALFGYTQFQSVLWASAVFVWFKYRDWSFLKKRGQKALILLSGCSFGIYLVHYYMLYEIILPLSGFSITSGWIRLILPIPLYLICFAMIFVLKKVPVVRFIIP